MRICAFETDPLASQHTLDSQLDIRFGKIVHHNPILDVLPSHESSSLAP